MEPMPLARFGLLVGEWSLDASITGFVQHAALSM
jgi:hypothetical protein